MMEVLAVLFPVRFPIAGFLVWVWLLRQVHAILEEKWQSTERKNVESAKYQTWLGRWFPGWYYLLNGPEILLNSYKSGTALAVKTPETCYVHISSQEQVKELANAPEEQLSLHALSKDMFTPKYTMNGLEVQDMRSENGSLHTRVLRVVLRSHLPSLTESLANIVNTALDKEIADAASKDSSPSNKWASLPSFMMTKKIITAANALVFFGPELSDNPVFLEAALAYPEDLLRAAEVLRLVPSFTHPVIAPILMRGHAASNTMVAHLLPLVEKRLAQTKDNRNFGLPNGEEPKDCIQFFIDAKFRNMDEWNAQKIVQVLLGVWFAAVHQPALTLVYALEDLCEHPEWADALRDEMFSGSDSGKVDLHKLDSLPLLDAFLKESSRLHPSDSIAVRRKVLDKGGFVFGDGTRLLLGDVACVPSQAIMRDEGLYTNSAVFDPWRFVAQDKEDEERISRQHGTRFTDATPAYPLWGLGRDSCPGRFYASLVLKLFIAHVLGNYHIQREQPQSWKPAAPKRRTFYFRSSIIPTSDSSFMFQRR